MATFSLVKSTTTKNRPRLSLRSRLSGLLSRSLETRGAWRCSLENASLWPLGHDTLVCAHGTTILINCEPSELVGERIFYALQVRNGLYKKNVCLKKFFIVYSITSGDENHLCRAAASLRDWNYKISLKAQKHGAGTPIYNSISVTELHE